jgi:hypothetical protein
MTKNMNSKVFSKEINACTKAKRRRPKHKAATTEVFSKKGNIARKIRVSARREAAGKSQRKDKTPYFTLGKKAKSKNY